eukprot:2275097-Rhodomonas_salina.1
MISSRPSASRSAMMGVERQCASMKTWALLRRRMVCQRAKNPTQTAGSESERPTRLENSNSIGCCLHGNCTRAHAPNDT